MSGREGIGNEGFRRWLGLGVGRMRIWWWWREVVGELRMKKGLDGFI